MSRPVVTLDVLSCEGGGGDVLLRVDVRGDAFTGVGDVWVLADAMSAFLAQARALNERMEGRATIESISPGEFALTVERIDAAGHLGVRGRLAKFASDPGWRRRFAFELAFTDQWEFEELRALAGMLEAKVRAANLPASL